MNGKGTVSDNGFALSDNGQSDSRCPQCRMGHRVYCFLNPDFWWKIPELTVPNVKPKVVLEVIA